MGSRLVLTGDPPIDSIDSIDSIVASPRSSTAESLGDSELVALSCGATLGEGDAFGFSINESSFQGCSEGCAEEDVADGEGVGEFSGF
jgi:hypothetical protein